MKKVLLIIVIYMGIFSCKQDASSKIDLSRKINRTILTPDLIDNPSDAKMDFENKEWDFGLIEAEEIVSYSFEFVNSGSDPLIISSAKGSCGCTVPEWPKVPIVPGERGFIDVTFNSKGKKGRQNKRVTLTTNVVPSQQLLTVKGEVKTKQE
jgi:hypothetical protein